MTKKTYLMIMLLAMFGLMTAGCFSIEQEIFLQDDGSGDMVMHLSLPDLPEELMKKSPTAGVDQLDPKEMIEEMKKKFSSGLPPTVQLKEAKEVKRNGAFGFYIVLHFKQLSDLESALDSFSKEGLGEQKNGEQTKKDESYWKVVQEKKGDLTVITQRMFIDLADVFGKNPLEGEKEKTTEPAAPVQPTPAPKAQPKQPARKTTKRTRTAAPAPKQEEQPTLPDAPPDLMKGLMEGEAMQMIFSMMFKFRFVVHAPKNFTETNADIVLNGKTAIWNASFGAFIGEKDSKEKKVLEMKVVY